MNSDTASSVAVRSGGAEDSRSRTHLHVLTLTPFYPSAEDEVRGCFVAETLRELAKLGVASSVIAVDSMYHARKHASEGTPAEWMRYPQLPGNFGLSSAGNVLGAMLLPRVKQLHRKSAISVLHAHAALPCGHAAAFLSKRLKIPFVVTVHGLDVFNSCFQQGIAARWRRKASSAVYQRAHQVICISEKVQRLLADGMRGAVSSKVIYNGTDPNQFAPGATQDQAPTILIVGNLLLGKGHELVLRALASLRGAHPGLQCRIIGEGADRNRFARLSRDLAVEDQVHFLGRQSRSQVADAMRSCTVFVLPSRYEGLGCVYLEAMSCGKPVVGCRGQGIDEIIEQGVNGWLIPVDGLEELVRGLRILLDDFTLRVRIGQAARRTILDRLSLSHQAQSLLKVYEEAAQ